MTESAPETTQTSLSATPSRPRRRRRAVAVFAILFLVLGIGAGGYYIGQSLAGKQSTVTERQTVQSDGNAIITSEEESTAQVARKVSPSVVSIVTQSTSNRSNFLYGGTEEGAGTGIVVGKDGYILTNKHVIDGANTVGVVMSDGTHYDDVEVLGSDPLNDVAFLKIAGVRNLPVAELGDSTSIRVGQKVIAIGNSLGQYQNTVTTGIISGTGRPIQAKGGNGAVESLTDLIQTDAAINPGNSGGPLLNMQGQVIGINTAIAEDAQGIGFAIPIGSTKGMLKGVLAGKGVERAYLGVSYVPITADTAEEYNLSVKKGAFVYSGSSRSAIIDGSPAAKAGLRDKDIITKVGTIEVGDRGGVSSLVAEYAPGDTIILTILRGNKTLELPITLAAYQR